ncbi:OmpA family protein [Neisseria sp. WLZKY-1]|jgi:putative cytochrome c oxidase, subunit II|uniref:OmpA family protein n=1 Tax=Neisseria sp. WLZKY-1 TaxID=3390377 RepID=UPI00397DDF23
MSSNQQKEQKIGLWLVGGAAGLSVLTVLFLSVWGWETGRIEGSPDYGRAASEASVPAQMPQELEGSAPVLGSGIPDAVAVEETVIEISAPQTEAAASDASAVPAAEAAPQDNQDEAKIVTANGAVKFYFASGKDDVAPGAQQALKDVLVAALAGKKVVVSGYHDNTGNAAFNEELSKRRALAVRSVLQGFGVPEKQIELRKPENTEAGSGEEARRVEVFAE